MKLVYQIALGYIVGRAVEQTITGVLLYWVVRHLHHAGH